MVRTVGQRILEANLDFACGGVTSLQEHIHDLALARTETLIGNIFTEFVWGAMVIVNLSTPDGYWGA